MTTTELHPWATTPQALQTAAKAVALQHPQTERVRDLLLSEALTTLATAALPGGPMETWPEADRASRALRLMVSHLDAWRPSGLTRAEAEERVTVDLKNVDSVSGRIVDFMDLQLKENGEPKTFPDGSPMMGTMIEFEGGSALFAGNAQMMDAIAKAVKASGAEDLEVGATLAVERTGGSYAVKYVRPEGA